VKNCWSDEALKATEAAENVEEARETVVKSLNNNGSITAVFERTGKGKVTYSNRQHTRTETRYGSILIVASD
jgi:uncharacterized DUF497 family protein